MNLCTSVLGRGVLIVAVGALLFACETSSDDGGGATGPEDVITGGGATDVGADVVVEPDVVVTPDAVVEPDVSVVDATEPDATEPDAGVADATEPDATEPDAQVADATEPDATEPEDTCLTEEDCTFTQYESLVTSEADCFCPMCPTMPVTVAVHNARSSAWSEHCSDWANAEPCPVPGCMDPGEATCSAGECVAVEEPAKCMPTGCSGEICADMEMMSTCDMEPWYICLELTTCGNFGDDGSCGWEPNVDYLACLEEFENPTAGCSDSVICEAEPPSCPANLVPVGNDGICWGGCGFPDTCSCDDGSQLTCKMMEPACTADTVLAIQAGCYACVDPMTCGLDPGPQPCGGFLGLVCEDGLECVDDPSDGCDPDMGGADCPGICVEPTEPGGCDGPNPAGCFTTGCPDGLECVMEGCVPSTCFCDEEAGLWACTADCGGGLCVEPGPSSCEADKDCPADSWCRDTEDGGTECTPYKIEGESCGGFVPFWMQTKCLPGLTCEAQNPQIPDLPGICVDPNAQDDACSSNDECTFTQYDILVTDESECFCPICPTLPVTNAEHNARYAAWQEHCGQWADKNPCPVPGCLDPGEAVCSEGQCVEAPAECITTGCSSEICSDMEMMSTCDIQPWYGCLELTSCGNYGENGTCAWEMNPDFEACLDSYEEPQGCPLDGVLCKKAVPECPEGLTPVQVGTCYGCGYPSTCSCDDGQPALCDMVPPECGEGEILAQQGGCFSCVDPMTCAPAN